MKFGSSSSPASKVAARASTTTSTRSLAVSKRGAGHHSSLHARQRHSMPLLTWCWSFPRKSHEPPSRAQHHRLLLWGARGAKKQVE
jgi:hypothetical protein